MWPILVPVAWGVLSFGAVYPWAYRPLMAAMAVVGAYGWFKAAPDERAPARALGLGLLVVGLVVALQLVPMPASTLMRVSPATDLFLRQYDVAYSIARRLAQPAMHPLSIAPDATIRGLACGVALGVFVVGCTSMLPRVPLTRLVGALIALAVVLALFGIIQKATFNDRIYWFWKPVNVASNAFGPFVNRNHFAGWMLMSACLTAGHLCGLLSAQRRWRPASWRERAAWLSSRDANYAILVAAAFFVMVLSIVWTLSRSGIGAMAIAGTLLGLRAATRRRGRGSLFAILFVVMALALAVAWRGAGDVAEWYGRTNTLQWRLEQWNDTRPIVHDFRWFGTGLNTYAASMLIYPTSHPESIVREAHNDYLQLLSEGGVALAFPCIVVVLLLVNGIWRAFAEPQSGDVDWIRAGAVTGLIGIAIQEVVDFSLQLPGNAVLFALLIAIALHRAPTVGQRGHRQSGVVAKN